MASLAPEQLAAPAIFSGLLALLVVFADDWKQLELCLPLGRTQQLVFDDIHSLRNDARCIFVFRLGYIVVEHVLPVGRS